jgi:hypothetical protein
VKSRNPMCILSSRSIVIFLKRLFDADEIVFSYNKLGFSRLTVPCLRVEYLFNAWGSSYPFILDYVRSSISS